MATELTAERVRSVAIECLFNPEELVDGNPPADMMVEADAIASRMGFHRERVAANRQNIAEMLMGLPDDFMQSKGGGMSFLNACYDRDGVHWAEHPTMGTLFALGEAAGLSKSLVPREMWSAMPGGMPYYAVLDDECQKLIAS